MGTIETAKSSIDTMFWRFVGRFYWGIQIEKEAGVYRATSRDFEWYIPHNNHMQAKWCMDYTDTHESYLDYYEKGDLVIEAGGATGEITVPASHVVGASGEIHSFEASPINYECLCKNVELHGNDNVVTNHRAISEKIREDVPFAVTDSIADNTFDLSMGESRGGVSNPKDEASYRSIQIETTTIDAYCSHHDIDSIDMLKLTINGHEGAALRGATNVLPNTKYVFVNHPYEDVLEVLDEFGFELEANREHDSLGDPHLWVNPNFDE